MPPVQPEAAESRVLPSGPVVYQRSLAGEYARLLLLLATVPLLIWFAHSLTVWQTGILCLTATFLLLVSLLTARGTAVLRIVVLVAMAVNVLAIATIPGNDPAPVADSPPAVPVFILLVCLGIASLFEIGGWLATLSRPALLRTLAWGSLTLPPLLYVVGVPLFHFLFDRIQGDEPGMPLRDAESNLFTEVGYRAARFTVFAVGAYLGACMGSFLNVVAWCVPRGEPVGLRDSRCPRCQTKISRIDNLPLFSYINLGAHCRNCQQPIPRRYLFVELAGGAIFGSLFLYQLVTGCANVPGMSVAHAGILWIILYPNWPVIGLTLCHALFMGVVLVLSLIEWDEQRPGLRFPIVAGTGFLAAALLYWPLQPIPLADHLPGLIPGLSPAIEQLLKLLSGGVLGALTGRLAGTVFSATVPSVLTWAFFLTGLVLGWQALLQVTALFIVLGLVIRQWPRATGLLWSHPTTILLLAIVIHHPLWKTIAEAW